MASLISKQQDHGGRPLERKESCRAIVWPWLEWCHRVAERWGEGSSSLQPSIKWTKRTFLSGETTIVIFEKHLIRVSFHVRVQDLISPLTSNKTLIFVPLKKSTTYLIVSTAVLAFGLQLWTIVLQLFSQLQIWGVGGDCNVWLWNINFGRLQNVDLMASDLVYKKKMDS